MLLTPQTINALRAYMRSQSLQQADIAALRTAREMDPRQYIDAGAIVRQFRDLSSLLQATDDPDALRAGIRLHVRAIRSLDGSQWAIERATSTGAPNSKEWLRSLDLGAPLLVPVAQSVAIAV